MNHRYWILGLSALAISGCASLQPPKQPAFSRLPVVTMGSEHQPNSPFILYIPAHHPFPVMVDVAGNLLDNITHLQKDVSIDRDIWVHENWISYDGITWQTTDKPPTPDIRMGMVINAKGATINVDANMRE